MFEVPVENFVVLEKDHVSNVSSTDIPHHTPNSGNQEWSIEDFRKNAVIKIVRESSLHLELDLIGVDVSIANAIRRILIGELPTMAVEKVYVFKNDSIIVDEVLSHRLGLVPILADSRMFDFRTRNAPANELNTLVFRIHIKCTRKDMGKNQPAVAENTMVYSSAIKWEPKGNQQERFIGSSIKVANEDILIARLSPGQEIEAELHCEKGIGRIHAKWSPVGTAFYRLLPDILIKDPPITGEAAELFAKYFPPEVIGIKINEHGEKEAFVQNARNYKLDRQVYTSPEFAHRVQLRNRRDYFIFSVESTGALPASTLFQEAILTLKQKCQEVRDALKAIEKEK